MSSEILANKKSPGISGALIRSELEFMELRNFFEFCSFYQFVKFGFRRFYNTGDAVNIGA
jgi:hypothetical protein